MLGAALIGLSLAAAPFSLALPGLNEVNLAPGEGALYGEVLSQKLTELGFKVVTARDIAAVVGLERQRELLGCPDTSCMAELTGALGVDGLVLGDVGNVEGGRTVNLKIVSKNGATLARYSGSGAAFQPTLREGARVLAQQLAGALQRPDLVPPPEVNARSGGGWQRPTAIGAMVVGGAALLSALVCELVSAGKFSALMQAATVMDAEQARNDGKAAQTAGRALVGVGGVAAVVGVLLLILPEGAPQPSVALLPGGGAFVLSGRWP